MKVIFVLIVSSLLTCCSVGTSADLMGNDSVQKQVIASPTIDDQKYANNTWKPIPYEADKIDQVRRIEIEAANEKYRVVPDEFRNVDFENFTYRNLTYNRYLKTKFIALRNGEFVYEYKESLGGTTYSFEDTFYLDLAGDSTKEAIVVLVGVRCGGSCDGGSAYFYFFSSKNGQPKFIGGIATGSRAGGCSLKRFEVQGKKLIFEQFGRCVKESYEDENDYYSCKFCVKDLTETIYSISNLKLFKGKTEISETPETNVMNYLPEIRIGG